MSTPQSRKDSRLVWLQTADAGLIYHYQTSTVHAASPSAMQSSSKSGICFPPPCFLCPWPLALGNKHLSELGPSVQIGPWPAQVVERVTRAKGELETGPGLEAKNPADLRTSLDSSHGRCPAENSSDQK